MTKTVLTRTPPNLIGTPRVDFNHEDFDIFLHQHGYTVIYEKAIKCPCRSKGTDNTIKCKNCGGTGWLFINSVKTKAALTSINTSTKYKDWTEDKMGTINMTFRSIDLTAFMDRVTVLDSIGIMSQVLEPKIYDNQLFCFTIYKIKSIKEIFMYQNDELPLKKLVEGTDFSFIEDDNKILFNAAYKSFDNFTISVRYNHYLQFHVIDVPHDIRNNWIIQQDGSDKNIIFPVQSIGRRSHYVLDEQNYNGNLIFDNSYKE